MRGSIIGLWASIETSIDLANSYAWKDDPSLGKVVPINLRWKLEFFDRAHREMKLRQPLQKQAKELIRLVKARQDDRHWLVHGHFDLLRSRHDSWVLEKGVVQPDGGMEFVRRTFTPTELEEIQRDLLRLSFRLGRYTAALILEMSKQLANDKRG